MSTIQLLAAASQFRCNIHRDDIHHIRLQRVPVGLGSASAPPQTAANISTVGAVLSDAPFPPRLGCHPEHRAWPLAADEATTEVAPVSWAPEHLCSRSPRWRRRD